MNIPVVYEDEWLLVVDKPSGLLTIPAAETKSRTLTGILNEDLKERGKLYRLHPCHRLDRETSGLIIYAKGKSVQKKMMDLFKQKKIKKTYVAFVQGILPQAKGQIRIPIEGMSAITTYRVKEERNGFSIVDAMPFTGRTNQIRIHFKHIGHAILGETKYAFRRDFKIKAKRLCLHAQELGFVHPEIQKQIHLTADFPVDFKGFLDKHK